MRALLPLLLALAVALAGCTQPGPAGDPPGTTPTTPPTAPPPASPPSSPPPAPPAQQDRVDLPFTFPKTEGTSPPGGLLTVPNGTLEVRVTATWSCSDAPCRMELVLSDANGTAVGIAEGNGTANVTTQVGRLPVGPEHPWGVSMLAREQGVRANGTIAIRFTPGGLGSPA